MSMSTGMPEDAAQPLNHKRLDEFALVTRDQLKRAAPRAKAAIERWRNDGDLDRDEGDWRGSCFLGALAEVVAADRLPALTPGGRLVNDAESTSADIDIGGVAVDIKLRKLWQREEPDLFVRALSNPSADAYVMVEADWRDGRHHLALRGWVAQPEVWSYGRLILTDESEHDKLLVNRDRLRPMETLPDRLDALRGDSQ